MDKRTISCDFVFVAIAGPLWLFLLTSENRSPSPPLVPPPFHHLPSAPHRRRRRAISVTSTLARSIFIPIAITGEKRNTALMDVQLSIKTCKKIPGLNTVLDESVLCAGNSMGADSCQGDSGGPLMWQQGEKYVLMGIVSYGFVICGQTKYPGVYTNVSSFMDWIDDTVNKN